MVLFLICCTAVCTCCSIVVGVTPITSSSGEKIYGERCPHASRSGAVRSSKICNGSLLYPPPLPYSLLSWLQPTDDTFVVCSLA